ncbi:hypothetical protein [Saccharopolyspora hattusasensis]|uniref:hypothetical protein n=1 Tax=Saccharopolyspora hattusasensis TaxID=1128679 RepID=UPI003D985266
MTAIGTRADSDELAPNLNATYDLIICHGDRVVFHDHYQNPERRLHMCVRLLTDSDVFSRAVDSSRAMEIRNLHQAHAAQWSTEPDSVVDAIAKLCRRWGVQIYVSTTVKRSAVPAALFSVITEYGPGQTVAKHFPTNEARRASLTERAEQFFTEPGCIPHSYLPAKASAHACLHHRRLRRPDPPLRRLRADLRPAPGGDLRHRLLPDDRLQPPPGRAARPRRRDRLRRPR